MIFLCILQTFRGNTNRNSIVRHYLQPAIRALSICVRPVSWRGHISMRIELYGRNAGMNDVQNTLKTGHLLNV